MLKQIKRLLRYNLINPLTAGLQDAYGEISDKQRFVVYDNEHTAYMFGAMAGYAAGGLVRLLKTPITLTKKPKSSSRN